MLTTKQYISLFENQTLHKRLKQAFLSGHFYLSNHRIITMPPLNQNDIEDAIQRTWMLVWRTRQKYTPTPLAKSKQAAAYLWVMWKAVDIRNRIDINLNRTQLLGADLSSNQSRLVSYDSGYMPQVGKEKALLEFSDVVPESRSINEGVGNWNHQAFSMGFSIGERQRKNTKKATKCQHTDRPNLCKGMCRTCYEKLRKKQHKSALKKSSNENVRRAHRNSARPPNKNK